MVQFKVLRWTPSTDTARDSAWIGYAQTVNLTADNPAARLRAILEGLRTQAPRDSSGAALARVLGVHPEQTTTLITAVAKAIELSDRAQRAVVDANLADPVTLKWVAPVTAALTKLADLNGPLRLVMHRLDDAALLSLQACERAIETAPAPSRTETHIAEAIALTDELLSAIHDADFDPAAHELMVRHVLALQQALKLYAVVGDSGIYDALLSTLAALGVSTSPDAHRESWYQRFKERIATIADLMTVGQGLANGVSQTMAQLPPGANPFGF